ncbi:MAG TPA: retropepsin-like aspartic protease [Candidatus Baltobacteraceae bacterium]|nr:retropepsin-like aspartic protease [Candidatus Baltobacteraceae bacterium]
MRWAKLVGLLGSPIFVVLGILSGFPLHAQEPGKPPVSSTIPFQLRAGFLVVVNGQIGDLEGLKFIVDTGASFTFIDRKVADRLKLPRRPGKTTNFDREVPVEWAVVPNLRVGPVRAGAMRVMVAKLGEYSEFAEDVDGIIGLDVLGRSEKISIDYEMRTMSWEMARELDGRRPSAAYFSIPFVVQGFPMHLILDTGFQGILLYKDRLRKGLPDLQTSGKPSEVDFGRLQTTQVKLPGVRLAGQETIATVFLTDGPDSGGLPGVDGYLGISALKAKRVEFDFAARLLRWE